MGFHLGGHLEQNHGTESAAVVGELDMAIANTGGTLGAMVLFQVPA